MIDSHLTRSSVFVDAPAGHGDDNPPILTGPWRPRRLDISAMYRRAADLIEQGGLIPYGVDIDVDIDGRYSVDGACRHAAGLPVSTRDIDADDKFRVGRNNAICWALREDLGRIPADWRGGPQETVARLRSAASKREAQRRIQTPPVEVAA